MKSAVKGSGSAFGDLGGMMDLGGFSSVLSAVSDAGEPTFAKINRADIKVYAQQRDAAYMESDDQSLADMAADMRVRGIIQPIVLCENEDGPEPWRLVAGERRYHSSGIAEIDLLPSMCYAKLTEQQIKDIQLAENIHRLNLSQINEAQVLKERLDDEFGGNADALCESINKSRSWVSKRLALLDLPAETQRLIAEGISSDLEVINTVRTIEKIDPDKARETVNKIQKETRKGQESAGKGAAGKAGGGDVKKPAGNARKIANKAKDEVKPPKAPRKPVSNPDNVATPRDESNKQSGPVTDVPPATLENDPALQQLQREFAAGQEDNELANELGAAGLDQLSSEAEAEAEAMKEPERERNAPALPPVEVLSNAFSLIFHSAADPKMVLTQMSKEDRAGAEDWLHSFYEAGVSAPNLAQTVIQGFRSGNFAQEGHGALALVAFLSGGEEGVVFNMLNILGAVKS